MLYPHCDRVRSLWFLVCRRSNLPSERHSKPDQNGWRMQRALLFIYGWSSDICQPSKTSETWIILGSLIPWCCSMGKNIFKNLWPNIGYMIIHKSKRFWGKTQVPAPSFWPFLTHNHTRLVLLRNFLQLFHLLGLASGVPKPKITIPTKSRIVNVPLGKAKKNSD